jgi:hypothetical protein
VAQALAEFATIGIVQRRVLEHHADRAAHLQHALDSRVVNAQAEGVLAFQRGSSSDEAFKLLRQYARHTNARIHDAAERPCTSVSLHLIHSQRYCCAGQAKASSTPASDQSTSAAVDRDSNSAALPFVFGFGLVA